MNQYLMEIKNCFGETRQFVVDAENRKEAIEKSKQNTEVTSFVFCNHTTLKVLKKLQGGNKNNG